MDGERTDGADWADGAERTDADGVGSGDWAELTGAAHDAMTRAYAPYSKYPVGAAARVTDGRIVSGCNVENAAYGVTLCAECGMISDLIRGGGGQLSKFVCVDGRGEVLMPCGRCRQLLAEHAGPDFVIRTSAGTTTMEGLLPDAFGAVDLTGRHTEPGTSPGGTSSGASGGAHSANVSGTAGGTR